MPDGKTLIISIIMIIFLFCPALKGMALAGDCQENASGGGTPTFPGNAGYIEGWRQGCECNGVEPLIILSSHTVTCNNYIEVWVDSGNQACPPYAWNLTGTGFHFNNQSGPETTTTDADYEKLEIWADSTACGSIIITVTDTCGIESTASVRQPDNGKWVLIEEITCGTVDSVPGSGTCHSNYYCTEGAYRCLDSWVAGTNMGTRWHPIIDCTKYPCTPYDKDYCKAAGFYHEFYHVGIHYKKKWIWDCP
jgi:hypothetical protein